MEWIITDEGISLPFGLLNLFALHLLLKMQSSNAMGIFLLRSFLYNQHEVVVFLFSAQLLLF